MPDTKAWHLLLEDLTDLHVIATTVAIAADDGAMRAHPVRAGAPPCRMVGRSPSWRLRWERGSTPTPQTSSCKDWRTNSRIFADRLGDRLSRDRRDLYERFLGAAPGLLARYHSHRNLTVVHGDAHLWNNFLPRDGGDDVRFFDWDSWRIGMASNDLAYMMATHWYPERRRRMERPLLDHYHAALVAHGVRGYDRHALDDDYRLSALWQLTTPVWQAAADLPPLIWWSHLERILLAVDDLGCRDLLSR